MDFVQVAEEEGEEPIELPAEEDGTLLLPTLQAQFPGSCGLKYRNAETKAVRGVRSNEGRFYPPSSETGWNSQIFYCVFPKENKRKSDDNLENYTAKTKRFETRMRCTDLIVLGLPWKTTEDSLRAYFEDYGEVLMAQIKKDMKSGQSKGFGFIRFASYETQTRVLSTRHLIDGRWCEVKVPNSKGIAPPVPCKVFVGRCTDDITADDLREYFCRYGEVTDVFIPKPFRAFSFVTFLDPEIAQSLCGEDHIIKGVSVHVSNAAPKNEQNRSNQNQNYQNLHYNGINDMHSMYNQGSGLNSNIGRNIQQRGGNSANNIMNENGRHGLASGNNMYNANGNNYGNGGGSGGGNGFNAGDNANGGLTGTGNMNSLNRHETLSTLYNRGNYLNTHVISPRHNTGGNTGGWNNQQNRGHHLDMPNLQALGINSQCSNPSNGGQNMNNGVGMGLNLNSISMNPAIVAAALNQWSLLGNQLQSQSLEQQNVNQSGNFLSWMAKGGSSGINGNLIGGGGGGVGCAKGAISSNNPGPSGNQGINSNESHQNGNSSSGGGQTWNRQNSGGVSQGPTDKSKFL